MGHSSAGLPDSFRASRTRFRAAGERVGALWPTARLHDYAPGSDPDLTIDWIAAPALERPEKLLVLTAGLHGIEGYVGAAMLGLFLDELLARLDPADTTLVVVHCLNPWGMAHRRRTNAANVDLNRNFLAEQPDGGRPAYDPALNPEYARLERVLNPRRPVRGGLAGHLALLWDVGRCLISPGAAAVRRATLLGQYRFPRGIYYGGDALQPEARWLLDLLRAHLPACRQALHLDLHTGYGPRYQMSLVSSPLEPMDSRAQAQRFHYPLVVKTNPAEFYGIEGDMIDAVYRLVRAECPATRLYAASFEFGTLGDSARAGLSSLQALIEENQAYWYGASAAARAAAERRFRALFAPGDPDWLDRALANARQAFDGILAAEGFVAG